MTSQDDQMIIRYSIKDLRKTSADLARNWSAAGVNVGSSVIRRKFTERERIARRLKKKQLLIPVIRKNIYCSGKNRKKCDQQKWRQVVFSDKSHFKVQEH